MVRVLVIDDDVPIAQLMAAVLEDAGFRVSVATAFTDLPPGPFDRVVTDLMSSGGYDAQQAQRYLRTLAVQYPGVAIILVTAHHAASFDLALLGVRRIVLKPFDVDEFIAAVREETATS